MTRIWNAVKFAFFWVIAAVSLAAARCLYGPWSRLIRLFTWEEYRYVKIKPEPPWTTDRLRKFFSTCKWIRDKWYYVDAIASPKKFFKTREGDCDEYAAFAARVLTRHPAFIMSATWYLPLQRKFEGHNVCLFFEDGAWWHIGNWGIYGPFRDMEPRDVALEIVRSRGGLPLTYSRRTVEKLRYVDGGILLTLEKSKECLKKNRLLE